MSGANIRMPIVSVYNYIMLVKCINVLFCTGGNVITYNTSFVIKLFQYHLDL